MTRSRSQSASARSSASSSSGSSSSASGSSSSSSSGSDSSSSDTEASQASKTSKASQRSRRSNSTSKSKVSVTSKLSGTVKNHHPIKFPSASNTAKRANGANPNSSSKSKLTPPNSGSVKNAKTQSLTKLAQRTFARKKNLAASSSESESAVRPVKRVGSKPSPTVSIITTSKKSGTVTNLNPLKKLPSKPPPKSLPSTHKKNTTSSANTKLPNSNSSSKKKSILKSIFSDNSSEESESASVLQKRQNVQPNIKKAAGSLSPKKKSSGGESSAASATIKNKNKPVTSRINTASGNRAASSTSLSATGSGSSNSSSSGTSSESSSDSEKKPANEQDDSPKSPSTRKRPVTRRRTVKSKTIPTTTTFTQNVVTKSSPQLTHWESDYSASDDQETRVLRVPAKTSLKPRPRPTDEDEETMDRERRCPFSSCDSSGHLSGKYPTHSMLSTCPKYQGFSPEECKGNAEDRRIRENERKKVYNGVNPHQKRPPKLSHDAKSWVAKMKDLKEKTTKDGLCSEYDMSLWVDGLSVAAGKIEEEQSEGIGYRSVAVGKFEMSCWCESPYPEPLCHSRRLFVCEFCLKPVQSGTVLRRHCAKCVWRHPPGDEIYRKDRLSVWEVDGKTQKSYCQNLCLLAKCFLDHKTLYLDVDPFLFYVMTVADSQGCHLVGYFSKEKNSFLNYNVSCILTLPPYQRKGFGRLLIDFSYLLTRVEGKVGSPEKPLSDLGLISYRSYWKDAVLRRMCACATKDMVVKDLSIELGVTSGDLISTLQFLGMLKYWKGKHIVLKKQDVLEEYLERVRRRGETKQIDAGCLRWRPFQPPVENSS